MTTYNTSEAGGRTGPAAKAVAQALHPHFVKEEEYAMPPLGLLMLLAKGELPQYRETILAMIDRLKKDFSHMLDEHKAIVVQLHKLMKAAEVEKRPEYVHLAERLMLHAHTEEEVLYPAAILIGKYLKLKTGRREG